MGLFINNRYDYAGHLHHAQDFDRELYYARQVLELFSLEREQQRALLELHLRAQEVFFQHCVEFQQQRPRFIFVFGDSSVEL